MIWLTSDTHFGHARIIEYCDRPFANVGSMDAYLINNWNQVVKPDDTVFHLGDFCMGDPKKYLKELNGNKVFLLGDHDKNMSGLTKERLVIIRPLNDEYGNQRAITLCHWAMRSWYKSHYASWHLFGHHHGRLEPYGLSFDIGVDCWDFYPVSLDEIAKKMATLKPIVDFRK